MADELALMAARWHCLVGCLSGNTNWIKRGTVLADWYSTRTDRGAASTVASKGLPGHVEFHRFRTASSESAA